MATKPSPQEAAQTLLDIIVNHFKLRPQNVLGLEKLPIVWQRKGYVIEDLQSGLKFAQEEGWIEQHGNGPSIKITDIGFSASGAKIPSPEEAAQRILKIFVNDFKNRPGDILGETSIFQAWEKNNHFDDLLPGLNFAVDNGWLERGENGTSYKLTEKGFNAA